MFTYPIWRCWVRSRGILSAWGLTAGPRGSSTGLSTLAGWMHPTHIYRQTGRGPCEYNTAGTRPQRVHSAACWVGMMMYHLARKWPWSHSSCYIPGDSEALTDSWLDSTTDTNGGISISFKVLLNMNDWACKTMLCLQVSCRKRAICYLASVVSTETSLQLCAAYATF